LYPFVLHSYGREAMSKNEYIFGYNKGFKVLHFMALVSGCLEDCA